MSLTGAPHAAHATDTTTLLIPALTSERPGLGFGVTAVVGLQVWQTLRKAPPEGPVNPSFGEGVVIWDPAPLERQSHETAEGRAKRTNILSQLVLWGGAYEYGGGVVAQFHLALPAYQDFRESRPELWSIDVPSAVGKIRITADLPSRRYSFEPIVLRPDIVQAYSNPAGLPLFDSPTSQHEIGRLGSEFTAIESRPAAALVSANGKRGWIRMTEISRSRSEVTDFVSALVRIYRADWDGAAEYLGRVIDNPASPATLRTDAYLLRAMAHARSGRHVAEIAADLDAASRISPFARRVAIYRAMGAIQGALKRPPCEQRGTVENIAKWLAAMPNVFAADDPWLPQLHTVERVWTATCNH
jgi:hypothetical protein